MRKPRKPPQLDFSLLAKMPPEKLALVFAGPGSLAARRTYYHWDELVHRPAPAGLTAQEYWMGLKLMRQSQRKEITLRDTNGRRFAYVLADPVFELLHSIDVRAGDRLEIPDPISNEQLQDRYHISSLIEEATASSQLEGAMVTRPKAREMLRAGRQPTNKSERMIFNNFVTMQRIEELKNEPLSPELVFELHRSITESTLDDPECAGRFRRPGDDVDVVDRLTREIAHVPPPARELRHRMNEMCKFANEQAGGDGFIHPIVRSIILHFWLAYDHPFVDGNGRTARALFYWSMLRSGYWLFKFLSVSSVILQGPVKYARAFLYTETDDNDLTYFLIYHLKVIGRSVEALREYVQRKSKEILTLEKKLGRLKEFNYRQRALLSHAVRHPYHRYTFDSHSRSHNVVHQTARTDLLGLVKVGIFRQFREGKRYYFSPAADIEQRLQEIGGK